MKRITTLILISLVSISIFSCSKDDDDNTSNDPEEIAFEDLSYIQGDEGSRIEVFTTGGKSSSSETGVVYTGQNILGWDGGQLLNLNYWKQLRILNTDFETLHIRMNIPSGQDFVEAAVNTHGLHGSTLLLQDTQFLDDVIVEMYTNKGGIKQFFGELTLRRNVEYLGDVLDLVGSYEIIRDNQTIKGLFWKKEVANW
ncbi:hypothetical protein GCM10009117_02330 [Gangjinia marincola]|uniref:Uncharacterized protein n=1 Tax=Gangjinia marincola TaxID=578463 RepID=A0ABP3XSF8_9FLAO